MSKNTKLQLERQRLLEENMFIEQKCVEALQHKLLASSKVKDHDFARYAMCKPLSEFQKNVECIIYYYNDLKEVYNNLLLRPKPVEENIQMTE
jgi:organic radical activating enzyme